MLPSDIPAPIDIHRIDRQIQKPVVRWQFVPERGFWRWTTERGAGLSLGVTADDSVLYQTISQSYGRMDGFARF
jgi:hypothetical protein